VGALKSNATRFGRIRSITQLHLLALLAYTGFAFLLLHMLWFKNATHVAGYDYFNYNWNFWWIRHAFSHQLSIYENNFVLFPSMSNYGYHALTAFWYPVWALLEPILGTLTTVNVIITIGCILNGYLLFAFLRSKNIHAGIALLGGLTLQALPIARYFYYNTHLNLMDWFWLPALLLIWKQISALASLSAVRKMVIWAVVMGIALWGLLLTDLQFPIFASFLLVPYGVWSLVSSRKRGLLVFAGIVSVSVGLSLMWFAGPLPYITRFEGALEPGPVEDRPGIAFPSGFLTMASEWWQWDQPSLGSFVLLVVLSALLIWWRSKAERMEMRRWFWFLVLLPPFTFALGPQFSIAEQQFQLPFVWLYDLTNGMFRMPWRLAPIGVIAAMVFVGVVWSGQFRSISRFVQLMVVAGGLLLMMSAVRFFETAPLQPVLPSYHAYAAMGSELGAPYDDYVVLQAPTGAGTGEVLIGNTRAITYQYYGVTHQKRMLNGFISRTPIDSFFYIETADPLFSWLGQRRQLDQAAVEAQLRERIYDWPVGYLVIHVADIGINSSTMQEIIGYLNGVGELLCPPTVEHDLVVYRTRAHPDGCEQRMPDEVQPNVYAIDIGSAGDERFIGWGWHWQEQVMGTSLRWLGQYPTTDVYVSLPVSDYVVQIYAQAFWEPREVRVSVNGQFLEEQYRVSPQSLRDYTFTLPASYINGSEDFQLTLHYDAVIVPVDVGQSADERRLAIAVDSIRFDSVALETP
jgi:hypothetical protein